ncbi:uncharacterized protein [Procambarus clarkii]|uniref:uncharacterized protein n=1 Tax=Procambarus clarkii TaxID=6728 RepID=UPI003742DA75
MEDDKVTRFIDTRDEQVLEDCTKAQLQSIADHFGIKLRSSRVGEKRLEIMAQLRVRDDPLGEERPQTPASGEEHLSTGGSSRGSSSSRRSVKLEILKLQLEAQLCREEREADAQLRKEEREAEAQLKREEREAQLRREEKRFRECTHLPGKSYAETARDMERKFLKWLESEGAKSAEDVNRLMVMEKFMSVLSPEIRLVYGHEVRSPLSMLKEQWTLGVTVGTVNEYVQKFKEHLTLAKELAGKHLKEAQRKMSEWYDKKATPREFQVGSQMMVLLPGKSRVTESRFEGPYQVLRRLGPVTYEISKPDRPHKTQVCPVDRLKPFFPEEGRRKPDRPRKTQVCHVDRLKPFFPEEGAAEQDEMMSRDPQQMILCMQVDQELPEEEGKWSRADGTHLTNSESLAKIEDKLQHLEGQQSADLTNLLRENASLFTDVPRRHECNARGRDYRKVNSITVADSHPMPRVSGCIDQVGSARYVSKVDLLKGYYQISLSPEARKILAFVTPDGLYQYKVLPFGMKNSGSCFQRMMNEMLRGAEGCTVYIDDIVVCADDWKTHLERLKELFRRLEEANLTVNLAKSEFGKAHLEYLGFVIGQGEVTPVDHKVSAIREYPVPRMCKELLRYLGMIGYYRGFCKNFSTKWGEACQESFEKTKKLLMEAPVLISLDFSARFILYVDASDDGIVAMLAQERSEVHRPVAFYSKKFVKYQRAYSTVEKVALALVMALKHFDVYAGGGAITILLFTDHNPLTFLYKMRNSNQRLTRWALLLREYWMDIKHIGGKDNVVADALSHVH